ncbi:hypothetical protein JCM16303_007251 [Sporobolomyces ruberrimus]
MAPSVTKRSSEPVKKKARRSKGDSSEEEAESGGATSGESDSGTEKKVTSRAKGNSKKASNGQEAEKSEKKGQGTKAKEKKVAQKGKRKSKHESDSEDGDEYNDGDQASEDSAEIEEDESDDGGKNTRVVKSIKKIAAPKSDADTSVILPTTMEFLSELRSNNDREWFTENEARYRHALVNFKSFMTAWVPKASEVDWQLPHLPTKDLMHRIYRDVRFSKDKTPYKTNLSFSHSRTGRKGPFAFYYFHISPGGRSLLAAGCWQPGTVELKAIRQAILDDPQRLRDALGEEEFVKLYGKPEPKADGGRRSIFGLSDQLKNAPKLPGVDKNHKDIDLLKCRSLAVESQFTDEEVLDEGFLDMVLDRMRVTAPFVQLLNEFISPSPPTDDEGGEEDEGEE